jgi:pimeloyl-ACP methyl ester carboxylesterase
MTELSFALHFAKNMIHSLGFSSTTNNSLEEQETIICLHGYLSHVSIFDEFQGLFQNVKCIPLPTLTCNVITMAKMVEEELNRCCITNYSIVSHSLGSIVGLYHQLITKTKARRVVCVACPLFGSTLSKFAIGPITKDLEINSKILQVIRYRLQSDLNSNVIFIQAQYDIIIRPILQQRNCIIYCIPCGHLGILLHPMFIELCKKEFKIIAEATYL